MGRRCGREVWEVGVGGRCGREVCEVWEGGVGRVGGVVGRCGNAMRRDFLWIWGAFPTCRRNDATDPTTHHQSPSHHPSATSNLFLV